MQGGTFDFVSASIFGVIFTVIISVIGELLPAKSEEI
jgi:hypothetical protein